MTQYYYPALDQDLTKKLITSLSLLILGSLLCFFDFEYSSTHNGVGYSFDFISDLAGMILITISVVRISSFQVLYPFKPMMNFIKVIVIIKLIMAVDGHFIYDTPSWHSLVSSIVGVASMIATIFFCHSMQLMSHQFQLSRSVRKWRITKLLFLFIWVLPLGLVYLSSIVAIIIDESYHLDLGIFIIPVIIIMMTPLLFFLLATIGMKRELSSGRFQ